MRTEMASPNANPNGYAQEFQSLIPTFSHPASDYVAAITAECLRTGCKQGVFWILPCMADKPTISHGLQCHIDVQRH